MSFSKLLKRMMLPEKDSEVIFDRDEPIGQPTDMVMPRQRWFRKSSSPPAIGHINPIRPIS